MVTEVTVTSRCDEDLARGRTETFMVEGLDNRREG